MKTSDRVGILGLALGLIPLAVVGYVFGPTGATPVGNGALGTFVGILALLGFLTSWIWALVLSARTHRWGWFVSMLIFPWFGVILYAWVGPEDQPGASAGKPQNSQYSAGDIATEITGGLLAGIWEGIKVIVRAIFS